MTLPRDQRSHPQIQVGDLVVICSSTVLFKNLHKGDVGVVIEIEPRFYNQPKSYYRETFEPVTIDRMRVAWTSGAKTYEPANCLKKIKEIKKNS